VPKVDHRIGQGFEGVVQLVEAFEPKQQAAKFIFPAKHPLYGIESLFEWAVTPVAAGVNLISDFTDESVARIAEQAESVWRPGDLVIASIHWGANWGYESPKEQRRFARALIDRANVSLVHGHSSHHAKAIESYKERLILYGCGDFLNDYEGIRSYEEFRGDLAAMYFAGFEALTGRLASRELTVLQIRRFQLVPASRADVEWGPVNYLGCHATSGAATDADIPRRAYPPTHTATS